MLSSGGFPEHHTTKDKIKLIDFDHLLVAANFLNSFIVEMGNKNNQLVWNQSTIYFRELISGSWNMVAGINLASLFSFSKNIRRRKRG